MPGLLLALHRGYERHLRLDRHGSDAGVRRGGAAVLCHMPGEVRSRSPRLLDSALRDLVHLDQRLTDGEFRALASAGFQLAYVGLAAARLIADIGLREARVL